MLALAELRSEATRASSAHRAAMEDADARATSEAARSRAAAREEADAAAAARSASVALAHAAASERESAMTAAFEAERSRLRAEVGTARAEAQVAAASLSETAAKLVEVRAELASRGAAAIAEADAARAAERRVAEADLEATKHMLTLQAEERVVEVTLSVSRRDRARLAPRSGEIGPTSSAEIGRDGGGRVRVGGRRVASEDRGGRRCACARAWVARGRVRGGGESGGARSSEIYYTSISGHKNPLCRPSHEVNE